MSDAPKRSAAQAAESSAPQADGSELKENELESVAGGRKPYPYPDDPSILPIYPIDPPVITLPYEPVVDPVVSTDATTS